MKEIILRPMTRRQPLNPAGRSAAADAEVLAAVQIHGGFTVEWATATQLRAKAIDRLVRVGAIKRIRNADSTYPWCKYELL